MKTLDHAAVERSVEACLSRYKDPAGRILNVLGDLQAEFRYLPIEVLHQLSLRADVPFARLYGLATAYEEFTMEPVGEHLVLVCNGTACHTRGAPSIVKALEEKLGIRAGETTPDGKFTLRAVYCVGSCGLAPVVVFDTRTLGRVRLGEAAHIVEAVS